MSGFRCLGRTVKNQTCVDEEVQSAIWGHHDGDCEDIVCWASGIYMPTPCFAFSWISYHWLFLPDRFICCPIRVRHQVPPKWRYISTRTHDVTSHDRLTFKLRTDYTWSIFARVQFTFLCLLSTVTDPEDLEPLLQYAWLVSWTVSFVFDFVCRNFSKTGFWSLCGNGVGRP
jgi:hypothetical protein